MAAGGEKTLRDLRGGLQTTVRALEPYLNPLTVKARLQSSDAGKEVTEGRRRTW